MAVEGFDLGGKKALVIGVESSAGQAIALALTEAGADVATASTDEDAESVASQIESAVQATKARLGRIDILVNCADLFLAKPAQEISDAEWQRVVSVNLSSVFFACRAVGPSMAQQGWGRIINVASGLGERGLPNCSAYCAAKGGVLNLTRALAQEWAAAGVTVNAIAPAWMEDTPGLGDPDPESNRLIRYIPMRRAGRADEIGPLAVYLASDSAGYMTGRTLFVDGGLLAHL